MQLAVLLITLGFAASCFGDPDLQQSETYSITFPVTYTPIPQLGVGIGDVRGDGSNNGREVVGNSTYPAVYLTVDGAHVFLRFRLDDTPLSGQNLAQFGWGC